MKKIILKVLIATLFLSLSSGVLIAKDKDFKFNYKMSQAKTITDDTDLKHLRAAEYTLKKGYSYFTIINSRVYDNAKKQKTIKFGQRRSQRPQIRTELTIHCYDDLPLLDQVYNAEDTKDDINKKYNY